MKGGKLILWFLVGLVALVAFTVPAAFVAAWRSLVGSPKEKEELKKINKMIDDQVAVAQVVGKGGK